MNCPHCNEELELDHDLYRSEAELSGTEEVEVQITFTLTCASCNEALGEYTFEGEQDISDFANEHEESEDHELSVALSNEEFTETLHNNILLLGAEATIAVSCICGSSTEFLWSCTERAEDVLKELE